MVEAYIARIKQVNPIVNAVSEDNFAAALEEADAADREAENARRLAGMDDRLKRRCRGSGPKIVRIGRSSESSGESHSSGESSSSELDDNCNHSPPERHRETAVGEEIAGRNGAKPAGTRENALTRLARERPLLGVPFTVKLCFAVRGKIWSSGLYSRRDVRAHEDADVVRAMRGAGAVLLCLTNMPDLGMWTETHNWQFGRTSNPYDTWRTSGGSSGGEGALVCTVQYTHCPLQ